VQSVLVKGSPQGSSACVSMGVTKRVTVLGKWP